MFLRSFNEVVTTKITASGTAQKAAGPRAVSDGRDGGRTALEINNVNGAAPVFVGDSTVTAETGIPVKAGEYRVFPVQMGSADHIYIVGSGDVIIAEYF